MQPRFIKPILAFVMLALFSPIAPAHADNNTVNVNNPAVMPSESAAQCYHDATEHLRKGAWYERAAAQLKEAVRQDPKNPDYHLALGCAYADRAASLGYASAYASLHNDEVAKYPKDLADWEKAQKDPKSDDYGDPRPTPPPAFMAYTKDDLETFTLTTPEAIARITDLAKQAQAEWKQAIALEKDDKSRAYAEYVQGWGLEILSSYKTVGSSMLGDTDDAKDAVPGIPKKEDVQKAFEAAIKDDPTQAIYWQSLGDSLGVPWDYDTSDTQSDQTTDDSAQGADSQKAYRHALQLDPKNALLWFYIAQFEIYKAPKKATEDLRQAVAADPTNAYPMYILADADLQQTNYINNHRENADVDGSDFLATEKVDKDMAATLTDQDRNLAKDAILLVEQGNEAPFCQCPMYHPPVPAMLTAAYNYLFRITALFPSYAKQRALARDLCGYTAVAALNGDLTTAFDVDQDIFEMGKKSIGDWSMVEDVINGRTVLGELVGMAIASIGLGDMVRIAQHYGDQGMADAIQSEYNQFKDQISQWKDARNKAYPLENEEYANY